MIEVLFATHFLLSATGAVLMGVWSQRLYKRFLDCNPGEAGRFKAPGTRDPMKFLFFFSSQSQPFLRADPRLKVLREQLRYIAIFWLVVSSVGFLALAGVAVIQAVFPD